MQSQSQNTVNQKLFSYAWLSFLALLILVGGANWALGT